MFGKADCGLGRVAALRGIGNSADCTLDPLQCKDSGFSVSLFDMLRDERRLMFSSMLAGVC
eukprot:10929736-Alexandrium_andersonii.AAC.1